LNFVAPLVDAFFRNNRIDLSDFATFGRRSLSVDSKSSETDLEQHCWIVLTL